MNFHAARAIYIFLLATHWRFPMSFVSPLVSTTLYFIVFGAAMGTRVTAIDGVSYGVFIIPGLIVMALLADTIFTAAYTILAPKLSGTIYEILSAPVSPLEIVLGHMGATATKSTIVGLLTLAAARLFVDFDIMHPAHMIIFLVLTSLTVSLLGLIVGIWAGEWHKLNTIMALIVNPLAFLSGSFYSIGTLPPLWRGVALFDPVVYVVSGFRWSFFGISDVSVTASYCVTVALLLLFFCTSWQMFRTGFKLRS